MQRRFFGTDGVRGPVGGPLLNASFVARLGLAAARWLQGRSSAGAPLVFIGRDTRASGPELELAVASGLVKGGCRVLSLGIVPTPAVSQALRTQGALLGVVITASHNPASDNGIKFFGPGGLKLSDTEEANLEALLTEEAVPRLSGPLPQVDGLAAYLQAAQGLLPEGSLLGWRIVVDCANGATAKSTPAVLEALGAEVHALGDAPDGFNINEGLGSEHPEKLAAAVLAQGASLGIAHDGDGDRCVFCDEKGSVLDGDEVLALLATQALRQNQLPGRTLVVTVQSNLGLDRAISLADGRVLRTAVGDRYVAETMRAEGATLGGESSGHIIFSDFSPTGDGLVAALKLIEGMLFTRQPLSVLRRTLRAFPQKTRALRVREKRALETLGTLNQVRKELEAELGGEGRLLVRYSGTESKLRLLVEGSELSVVEAALWRLEAAARTDLEVLDPGGR